MTGYQNLCRLVTDAHIDGYYYKPRIDREHLAKHSQGLVGMSACLGGEIPKALEVDDWELARTLAGEYGDILGKDRFFLELQDHGIPEQRRLNEQLLRLAPETGLPLVVTNDLHYVHQEQHEAHDVLLCVGTGSNLDTPEPDALRGRRTSTSRPRPRCPRLFPDQREALLNTRRIAEMVDLKLPLGELRIPHFPVPDGETVESWLRKECEAGLVRRYGAITPELQARLDYELGVILSMGYAGYFLIVADFVRFAREQGIATTCRGSAPGSIVTYTLGITPVDPLHYGLPFERFLNPDRVTMPDIDVDFEDERRDEVINYVSRKYGHGPRRPDHHVRHDARPRGDPRRRPGDGHGLRRRGPDRQGRPQPAGHQALGGPGAQPAAQGDARRRPPGRQADRARPAARGRRAQRVHPRGRRGDQPRAADRADAAPEGDQLRRAHDPVRDARHRGAGPAQVRLPGPVQPHDPAQGRRPDPRAPRGRGRPRQHPARRPEDVRAPGLGRDDGRVPARVRGHAPLRPRAAADLGLRPGGHGGALPPGPDGQHPGLHPAQARPGAGRLPPPAARAVPEPDLRDLRVPGGHHGRGHGPGRLHAAPRRTCWATRSARRSRRSCGR